MGFVIIVIVIFGIGYIVYRIGKQDKQEKVIKEQPIVNKPVMKRSLLTEEEKETSDNYCEFLLYIAGEIAVRGIDEQIERECHKECMKMPRLIYSHACNRLGIEPWSKADMITKGLLENTFKALDHAPIIQSLQASFPQLMMAHLQAAEDKETIDWAINKLIIRTAEGLKRIK